MINFFFLTCASLLLLVFFTLFCGKRSVKKKAPHSPSCVGVVNNYLLRSWFKVLGEEALEKRRESGAKQPEP